MNSNIFIIPRSMNRNIRSGWLLVIGPSISIAFLILIMMFVVGRLFNFN